MARPKATARSSPESCLQLAGARLDLGNDALFCGAQVTERLVIDMRHERILRQTAENAYGNFWPLPWEPNSESD
jgi:hypothetical protein